MLGKQNATFSPKFTKHGKVLLVQPCTFIQVTADCFPGITLCNDAWMEGKGPAQVRCTGEIPLFRSFYRDGAEWSGLEDSFPFFFVPRRTEGRHWQHRNQIRSHSAVRGKIISGGGGERPSLSLLIAIHPQDLLSGDSEGGASVLIFRVVAQATCVKLKSTIALSIDAASEVNLRAISVTDPALPPGSGLQPLSLKLVWIATDW